MFKTFSRNFVSGIRINKKNFPCNTALANINYGNDMRLTSNITSENT